MIQKTCISSMQPVTIETKQYMFAEHVCNQGLASPRQVVADSSRYEWAQLPGLDKTTPKAGMLTPQVVNPTDNTASFAYIVKVYTGSSPRTFNEAKGLVMNDYQAWLEEQWIKGLRKKYPVIIDEKVLESISK